MQEEIQDVVNENDEIIGTDTRDNIWNKGLQHNVRTVNIFLFNSSGELLVPLRSKSKKIWPGCYDFSCGENVISGESYDLAAERGLQEELGLSRVDLKTLGKLTPKEGIGCFATTYEGHISDRLIEFNQDEVKEIFWMSIEEIKVLLINNPEKFKRDYRETFLEFYGK